MSLCGSTATTKLGPDNAANNNTLLPNKEILIQGHLIFDKLNVMGISFSLYFFFNSVLYAPNWRGRCNRPRGLTGETDGAGGATCVRPNMTAPKPLCINCLFGSFFYGRRKQVWGASTACSSSYSHSTSLALREARQQKWTSLERDIACCFILYTIVCVFLLVFCIAFIMNSFAYSDSLDYKSQHTHKAAARSIRNWICNKNKNVN